jgi:hypothetical protein
MPRKLTLGFYGRSADVGSFHRCTPASATALCELCGREIVADRAEHYRVHLEHALGYLELADKRKRGGDPSWSATAREWIERCETMLAELEGTVN